MNNTQALAMTEAQAEALDIRTISDFVAQASNLVLIGPPEFEVREDGCPVCRASYGDFSLKDYKAVDAGLRYKAWWMAKPTWRWPLAPTAKSTPLTWWCWRMIRGCFPPTRLRRLSARRP
jgi:hypothetical protein